MTLIGEGTVFTTPSLQGFVYTTETFIFNPSTAVDGTNDAITIENHGLETGSVLIYHVHSNLTSTSTLYGMDPTTLEATGNDTSLTSSDPEIGGLEDGVAYYVVVVDENTIRLVSSLEEAQLATIIELTATGSGTQSISIGGTDSLTISATLSASESQSISAGIGGTFGYNKYGKGFLSKPDLTPGHFPERAQARREQHDRQRPEEGGRGGQGARHRQRQNSWTGAVGVAIANHDVAVTIGENVTGSNTTQLVSAGSLAISSTITQSTSVSVSASTSKPDDGSDNAASIALSVGFSDYHNSATVDVFGTATLDAAGATSIGSSVSYPLSTYTWPWANDWSGLGSAIQSKGLGGITYYDDGMLGLSNLINNSVTTSASGGKNASNSTSVGLSFNQNIYHDTSHVTIHSGAQINQLTQYVILGRPSRPRSIRASASARPPPRTSSIPTATIRSA